MVSLKKYTSVLFQDISSKFLEYTEKSLRKIS